MQYHCAMFAQSSVALLLLLLLSCSPSAPPPPPKPPDPANGAKVACQQYVRNNLKAPLTAKFQSQQELLAFRGASLDGGGSPASIIAFAVSTGLRDPTTDSRVLDKQLNFLTSGEWLELDKLENIGGVEEARKVVHKALLRRFAQSEYVVAGYVHSQNSFGAMLRSSFICLTSSGANNQWRLDALGVL